MFYRKQLILTILLSMVASFGLLAQNRTVTGFVRDAKGEPLMGAGVVLSGTTRGTVTDFDGAFSLSVPTGAVVLDVSSLGYVSTKVNVPAGQNSIVVALQDDALSLNETVVVGYGTQKKVNMTGAVEAVAGEELQGRQSANLTQMLVGAVPNLNITLADGKPGRTADFNVRGTGSINGGSALVLIDGVEGDPSMVNPDDIESISVLKDAASSAIYGARAPYGVVLITTKNAASGKAKVSYSGNFAMQRPENLLDLVTDGYVWAEHFYKAYNNYQLSNPSGINKTQQFSLAWLEEYKRRHDSGQFGQVISDGSIGTKGRYVYYPESVDYIDALYKDWVFSQNQNLSISGTDGKFDYYLSGRIYTYDGLFNSKVQTDKYKSFNTRFKAGYQVTPWLKIMDNIEMAYNNYYNPRTFSEGSGEIWRCIADEGHPSQPIYNEDGTVTYSGVYTVGDLLSGKSGMTTINEVVRNTASFTAKFFENKLRFNGDLTYRKTTYDRNLRQIRTPYSKGVDSNGDPLIETIATAPQTRMYEYPRNTRYIATNIYGEYENTFAEKHYFKAMAGWNYEQSQNKRIEVSNTDLLTEDVENINLAFGTDSKSISSSWSAFKFGGFFGRLNYVFDNRYLLEINGRYDVSSRFPANHRWAFFPSVSVGWRITEEPWWNISPAAISQLKLRASYGSLGNANGLGNYQYKQTLGVSTSSYILDGIKQRYLSSPSALPEDLTWETATTYDAGVDFGFLNGRLSGSFDYYLRKTINMIVAGPTVPNVFGASSPKGNYADLSTYGFEASITWKDQFDMGGKPFRYSLRATLSDYYSIIDKYNNEQKTLSTNANQSLAGNYYVGMRMGELWGFTANGLWQDQAAIDAAEAKAKEAGQKYFNPLIRATKDYKTRLGDTKYEDLNGNGYIDRGKNTVDDPGDRKIIGNEDPRYMYSFTINLDWNNIWVTAFFQGVGKQDWYPSNEASTLWGQYNRPYGFFPKWQLGNYWTEDNPDAYMPRYSGYNDTFYKGTWAANTRYIQNVAYIRLKNLQVGYNLPKSVTSRINAEQIGIFFSGENVWTWSPLYKLTRDVNVSNIGTSDVDLSTSRGDAYNYPIMSIFSLGLNITF